MTNTGTEILNREKTLSFFESIFDAFPIAPYVSVTVVTHILPDRPYFLEAIGRHAKISKIFYKPKTADPRTLDWLSNKYVLAKADRTLFENPRTVFDAQSDNVNLCLLDIGGLFFKITARIN